ncbi:MAG: Txe/YoeB family addiction module toxin [Ignavibacteriae bacterium HGW-Ignavibacteriae-4]|nr:MAG: Txe/YoeB family addiction module toxin [Ignavibacteriae bacterium HGW-Ignavibacteriae-4]
MNFEFTKNALEDYNYWLSNDTATALRIKDLLKAIKQDPFKGIGKPEPLKYDLKGYWSRRITREHRLVYTITGTKGEDQKCIIIQCRFHY